MKRATKLVTIICGFAIGTSLYLLSTVKTNPPPQPEKTSFGSKEDPQARIRFDWLRLRNPRTNAIPKNIRQKELAYSATLPSSELNLTKPHRPAFQNMSWTARGPFNIGGRTRALAIDVTDENTLLAGAVSGGVWRSTDGGNSWTKTSDPAQLHNITSIAQDTRNGKTAIWYVGTGEFVGNSASAGGAPFRGDGVFKSTDGGLTWTLLSSTSTGIPQTFDQVWDYVWNIVTDASNLQEDEVYAATYGAVHRSVNGGTSWTIELGGSSPFSSYTDVAITSTGTVYAALSDQGADSGIWRSTDGMTWTNITPVGWPDTYDRIVIGIAPSYESVVYFLASTPGSGTLDHSFWKYTYESGDGSGVGGIWENRSANIPAVGGAVGDFDSQSSYDMVVKVKPDEENTVFIGGTNLYRSTDGFESASNMEWIGGYSTANDVSIYQNHHPDQHALAFLPSDALVMISAHDGGLSKTSDDLAPVVSWSSLNNGYFTTQFYSIAIDHTTPGNHVIIGGMQDNGTWFTNNTAVSSPWVEILGGDGSFCAIAVGRSYYYVSFPSGSIYRFVLDNEGTWFNWTKVTPTGASGFLFVNPFALDPNNTDMMYLPAGSNLWRNSDLTEIPAFSNSTTTVNWTNLTNAQVANGTISAVVASTTPANRLYYGTSDGQVYRLDGANTGDPNPVDVFTGKGLPAGYVNCIAVDPTDADKALLVFSNYEIQSLFYTDDGGTSWTDVSGNLEQNPDGSGNGPSTRWAAILPGSSDTFYFVATSTGLYSTMMLNGTATVWTQQGASTIGNVVVDMIDSRMSDGLVTVATHGRGIFSSFIDNPVPVELISFTGKLITSRFDLVLEWQTATESNNFGFDIERCFNLQSNSWETIGFVKGSGTTHVPQQYSFTENVRATIAAGIETTYYRLKQIDTDGTFVFSNVIEVALEYQPESFVLHQNYPNPFNPTTRIAYELPARSQVKLDIYNTTGQRIATLVNQVQEATYHEVIWDATQDRLASGLYFYRLDAVSLDNPTYRIVETKRMLLVK